MERLKCEATTLAIFDPIAASQDVILGSGRAKQCPQVVIGGVECDNALRKWLARKKYDRDVAAGARDGEEEDDDERPSVALEDNELLYRLFELLALGGPLAQPDLELDHYLKATKALYRDCVQIARKRSSDGATCLANEAYEVAGPLVFGNGDPRPLARCFVITEPKRAKALVLFSPARGMWAFFPSAIDATSALPIPSDTHVITQAATAVGGAGTGATGTASSGRGGVARATSSDVSA